MNQNQRELYDDVKNASGTLYLSRNRIGDEEAKAIAEALKVNTTLTHLFLGGNQIGDAGARAIAEALKVNKTVTLLSLSENQIGDVGAQAIAEVLKVNTMLKDLNLNKNQIGDVGAHAIAEALKVNKTLTYLDLHQNLIGDAGARANAQALKVNKTLKTLNLSQNFLTNTGINALKQIDNAICKLDHSSGRLDHQRAPSPAELAQIAARAAAHTQLQPSVTLATENRQLRSKLAAQEQVLSAKDQALVTKDQELATNKQELATRDQALAAKDQELQQLRIDLAAKDQKLATTEQELVAKDQQLATKDQELTAKDQELDANKQKLTTREQELATKHQEFAAKDQELATKDQELQQLRSNLKSAFDRIDVLECNQLAAGPLSNFDGPIPQVPLAALASATNNFAADSLLGEGAFGRVYGASLPGPPVAVAIKKLSAESIQHYAAFQSELKSLSKFRHTNIIAMLSYAEAQGEYCLVYEFMPNGSARDRLNRKNNTPPLTWSQRHRIAADVARGMHYVQTAFPDHVLFHLDLKTDNVLLDAHFNAKVSDFGLVRAAEHLDDKSYLRTKVPQGTAAYMCPEFLEGRMTIKTDVYAFGMILLELVTAAKPGILLKRTARKAANNQKCIEMLDSALHPTEAEGQSVSEIVTLALECLDDDADERPSFGRLLATLDP
ncbi:interleukin-1 receptor-associated kinase 4 [Capsaspora owczarzaki ATCC 30864]|uniref:TKL/IRAK protein kinase n=1 Tax=Capsaspora owczarzaki (strain ATCC 30864) TaxID=595528 RepID=A0A0D2WXE2_CAPO3|nr:interleukin-1 receptor-associated kinase 4 [Capsaspora owczarzaki ATCC 30864]KJE97840.1 TKL/IRAK protein kinase [Capsaspora owczarzaki ATCC 30864]|eukprot:XP_004343011.1 interleukin-1 receptor-associated kinase 4 [Capsaspora owczarzaki ATCC 30864]